MEESISLKESDKALRVNEARLILNISRDTIYDLMKSEDPTNKLNYTYVGKTRRIMYSEIERYLRNNNKK